MKKPAFILALIAGLLCITTFIYKLVHSKKTDYAILAAGIFVISYGISTLYSKPRNK